VNNAGTAIPKTFEETTLEELDRVIDINVRGTLVATQAALKHMKGTIPLRRWCAVDGQVRAVMYDASGPATNATSADLVNMPIAVERCDGFEAPPIAAPRIQSVSIGPGLDVVDRDRPSTSLDNPE